MTKQEFVPFLINDRSSALLHLIDSFQLTETETMDIIDGCFMRLKEGFNSEKDKEATIPTDVKAVREYVASLKADGIYQPDIERDQERRPTEEEVNQTLDGLTNDLDTDEKLLFEVEPLEAYMILGMVQAAIVSLEIPENLQIFGRAFIKQFCDRYRIMFPDLVKTLELGWTVTCTSQEFNDLMDSDEDDLSVEDFLNSGVLIHVGKELPDEFQYVDDFE